MCKWHISHFLKEVNTRHWFSYSYVEFRYIPLEINSRKNSPIFDKLNDMEEEWWISKQREFMVKRPFLLPSSSSLLKLPSAWVDDSNMVAGCHSYPLHSVNTGPTPAWRAHLLSKSLTLQTVAPEHNSTHNNFKKEPRQLFSDHK